MGDVFSRTIYDTRKDNEEETNKRKEDMNGYKIMIWK